MAGLHTSRITTAQNTNLVIQPSAGKNTKITSINADNPGTTPLACDNSSQAIKKFVITDLPVKNSLDNNDSILIHDSGSNQTKHVVSSDL